MTVGKAAVAPWGRIDVGRRPPRTGGQKAARDPRRRWLNREAAHAKPAYVMIVDDGPGITLSRDVDEHPGTETTTAVDDGDDESSETIVLRDAAGGEAYTTAPATPAIMDNDDT